MHRLGICLALLVLACAGLTGCKKARNEDTRAAEAGKKAGAQARAKAALAAAKVVKPIVKAPPPSVVEKVPHPDFPTAAKANSEGIFLLEEPERGPVVATMTMPDLGVLKWRTHTWCEVGHDGVDCGPERPDAARAEAHWRVGSRAGKVLVATERFGPRVDQTLLFERAANGQMLRMVALDSYETVTWSRHFDATAHRYTSREATGGNMLRGCGQIQLVRNKGDSALLVGCRQWNGEAMVDTNGVAFTRLERDKHGLVRARVHQDKAHRSVDGHDGAHKVVLERDDQGRPLTTRYFDLAGFPVLAGPHGCYALRRTWDKRGLLAGRACLDAEDKPTADIKGVCHTDYKRDGRGCKIGALERKPGKRPGACREVMRDTAYQTDHRCAVVTSICRNGSGARVACGLTEPAEYRYVRDDRGRIVSVQHFDAAQQPAGDASCHAFEIRKVWDERGRQLQSTFHGAAGEPVECSRAGYHGLKYERDDAGRVQTQRFIALDGSPGSNLGCSSRHFRYDNYDHTFEVINYGEDGKLKDVLGMATKRYLFDEGHRDFAMLLYNAKGEAAQYTGCFTGQQCPKELWHAVRARRQANGKVTANVYFDADAQLVATFDCAKKRCWAD